MSVQAAQTVYRQEFVTGFEQLQTLLRDSTTTEVVVKGSSAIFCVADSGGATAVTRGANGKIPSRANSSTQNTATLVEWHDKPIITDFDAFASQGNQRAVMQKTSMGVINRKIDSDIITALDATSNTLTTAGTATMSLVMKAKTILGNNEVPWDSNLYGLVTPAFEAYLMQIPEFASADYVDSKPMAGADYSWADRPKMREWAGVKWIVHPNLSGKGTSAEKCFMYHKSAIGHACDKATMDVKLGYNDEDHYWFARHSVYMGSKLLQAAGVVEIQHDGSAYTV